MNKTKLDLLSTKSLVASFCAAVVSLMLTTPAHAYFDAGTISILWQGLIGGVAVAMASISIFWNKISRFLFGNKSKNNEGEQTNEESSE